MDISKDELRRIVNKQKREIGEYQKILAKLTSVSGVGYYRDDNTMVFSSTHERPIIRLYEDFEELGYESEIIEMKDSLTRYNLKVYLK